MFQRLAKNTVANGASIALRIFINFWLTSFLVNSLGNELYGLWTLGLTFTLSGALSLFSLGFQGALVKYVAEYSALKLTRRLNEVISATLLVYSASAAIGCAVVLLFARYWLTSVFHIPAGQEHTVKLLVCLFAIQLLIELPGLALEAIPEGLQRFDVRSVLDVVKSLLFASLSVLAVRSGHSVAALGFISLLVTAVSVVLAAAVSRRLVPALRLTFSVQGPVIRDLLRFTKDLFLLRINAIVYNNMDKWIIGGLLAPAALGEYDIANRIHGLTTVVMGLASSAVMPATSVLDATGDRRQLRILLLRGTKYALAITLPVVCSVTLLAGPLLAFWISPAHTRLALYVQLFMAYMIFWAMTPVYWNMLVGIKATREMMRIQAISVVVNLVLTFILVRRIGLAGAMTGTIVGNAIALVPYTRLALRKFEVGTREFVRRTVLTTYPQAAAAALALVVVMRLRPPASLVEVGLYGGFCCAAFLIAFALTGLDAAERRALRKLAGNWRAKAALPLAGEAPVS